MKKKADLLTTEKKLMQRKVLIARVPPEMAFKLTQISKQTGASKNFLIQEALRHFLGSEG